MKTFALFLTLAFVAAASAHGHGTSYAERHDNHGEHQEISVESHGDKHGHGDGHHHVDYVHHPSYHYSYGVSDPKTKDSHSQWEHRDGDKVHGEYSLDEADGTKRIVKYSSDKKTGFTAHVERIGHAAHDAGHGGHGHH
jgi:Insect cuticle protein